jgi:hypothetical protein
MRRYLLPITLGVLVIATVNPALADNPLRPIQFQNPAAILVGTWRSGNFAFTFSGDGTYVYVGAMGGGFMRTQSSESGTYTVAGDTLTVQRKNGVLATSQNYRQDLGPSITVYRWRFGNTPTGPALQLVYPNGGTQIFYRGE